MQKLILLLSVFIGVQALAQPFEGTVTWSARNTGSTETTGLTVKVKGGTVITVMNGGMMNGMEIWFSDHGKKVMRVMRDQKMFVVLPPESIAAADKNVTYGKFTATPETATILGYVCMKFTGEVKERGISAKMTIWTTTQLKDEANLLVRQPNPFTSSKLPVEIRGIPLKIEKIATHGTEVLEVTDIKAATLNAADFTVPPGFTEMGRNN